MNARDAARRVESVRDPRLSARVVRSLPMAYTAGPDAAADRPAHVRAASGLAWIGDRVAVIQDDANFVALVDPGSGAAEAVALPRGAGGVRLFDDGRGNKAHKLDLEAVVRIDGPNGARLLALGSGSTLERQWIALVGGLDAPNGRAITVVMHRADAFYGQLLATKSFAGSEMNIEGATLIGSRLRLFSRGNGAIRGTVLPLNATGDVDWTHLEAHLAQPERVGPPALSAVTRYELGALGGVRLGFTDAAVQSSDESGQFTRTIYSAAAEESPDVARDGAVAGSAIGVVDETGGRITARWIELSGEDGLPTRMKVEGVAVDPRDPSRAFVTVDRDDHARPSLLCEIFLDGPWLGAGASE